MAFTNFYELATSPVLDVSPANQGATREAYVPWDEVDDLIDYVFPVDTSPRTYPGRSWLVANAIHVEPIGDKAKIESPYESNDFDTLNTFTLAKVRVTYATSAGGSLPDSGQGQDPVLLLSHRWSIGGEFLTLPYKTLRWADGEEVEADVNAGVIVPTIEHEITWPRVAKPPFSTIRASVGCVNSAAMTFKTGSIYPETLVFLGAELQRDILSSGVLAWEVTYRFSERRVKAVEDPVSGTDDVGGWNHFYRSEDKDDDEKKGGWHRLEAFVGYENGAAVTESIYELKDLKTLFVQDA